MLETDVLFAHLKEKDWLKEAAERILATIDRGGLGRVLVSRECLHELYYLVRRLEWSPSDLLTRVGALTRIRNLMWLPTDADTDLLALSLISTYKLSSIFDAYHAAACLLRDPQHEIMSTDPVYERIPQIKRIDPRSLAKQLG